MQLITINKSPIGDSLIETVNARDLHAFLESKQEFRHWIKDRVEKYDFTEGRDFVTAEIFIRGGKGTDYHISLDMAKELSMVERNDKGKQARQYFIECERKIYTPTALPTPEGTFKNYFDLITHIGFDRNVAIVSANNATKALTGVNISAIAQLPNMESPKQELMYTPSQLGQEYFGISAVKFNKLLECSGLQKKSPSGWEPTTKAHSHYRLLDSSKRHNNGAIIQQVKWYRSVLKLIDPAHLDTILK